MDKHKLILIQLKLQSSILIPRIWAGYIYGFWLGLSISIRYLQFAAGNTVGIFDSFLLLYNDIFQVTLLVIGFFIIIADAPFVNSMTYFTLIRSSGLLWRLSMTSYLLIQLLIYQAIIIMGCIFPIFINGNFTFEWSDTIQILIGATPQIAMTEYSLPIPNSWILRFFSVNEALFHSFLLTSLYCSFLGIMIFIGNLNSRFPMGMLFAIGIHFSGMLLMSDFVPSYHPAVLAHGIMQFHIPGKEMLSFTESYSLFLLSNAILLSILTQISGHIDYNIAVSQKNW